MKDEIYGSSRKMTTPEGLLEGSIGWVALDRNGIDEMANSWFEEYGLTSIKDTLPHGSLDADDYMEPYLRDFAPTFFGDDEKLAIPELELDLADLGEEISLLESKLGTALISALESAGVNWRFDSMEPFGSSDFVQTSEAKFMGLAQWQTYFGTNLEQTFRVFRNPEGHETCLWSANVLAATRPFEHMTVRENVNTVDGEIYQVEITPESIAKGALTFGQWSTKIFIPQLAKLLFYLAETPFPSNALFSFSRAMAFGEDFPNESYPRPVILNKRNSFARGAFRHEEGGLLASGAMLPNVIEMGWTFSTTDQSQILKILGVVTNGLIKIASIVEDGFLNHRTNRDIPYDDALLSATMFDSGFVLGGDAQGLSYWVPVVRLGFVLDETNTRMQKALGEDNVAEQVWAAFNGVGKFVPEVINTLVFGKLIPDKEWSAIDRLLDCSVRMDLPDESTNSLSNWGIAKYMQGLFVEAIEKFELALARSDKYAEAEASYWLAKIWKHMGEPQKAEQYSARCQEAGGWDEEMGADSPEVDETKANGSNLGLTKSSTGGLSNKSGEPAKSSSGLLSLFCSQCGTKFPLDSAKFCTECGTRR